MLEAREITREFDGHRVVDGLSFQIPGGELYGLVGPDGAGKTTTMRLATGLLLPTSGRVTLDGEEVTSARTREQIGYMPQQYALYRDLSVDENLEFFGLLFGLDAAERSRRKERLLDITRLSRFTDRRAEQLSGGMYKKLALACALLHQPRLLVLDEPSNGIDPVSRRELWDLLYEFVEDGMAVVLATPIMEEAARCHRVALLHDGRFLAEGPPASLVESFPHHTFVVRTADRDTLEDALHDRGDVLAVSPEAKSLRVVIRQGDEAVFSDWAKQHEEIDALQPVAPTFEDVFLGLTQS